MIRFIKYSVSRRREKFSRKNVYHERMEGKNDKNEKVCENRWVKMNFNTKWNQPKIVNYLSFL